jgi:hypothetical protein
MTASKAMEHGAALFGGSATSGVKLQSTTFWSTAFRVQSTATGFALDETQLVFSVPSTKVDGSLVGTQREQAVVEAVELVADGVDGQRRGRFEDCRSRSGAGR